MVAAALTLLVKAFVVQVYRIPSASMENTLQVGDRVLVNKLVYHFRGIARGDIIVFSGQDSWGPDAPPPANNGFVRFWDEVLSDRRAARAARPTTSSGSSACPATRWRAAPTGR